MINTKSITLASAAVMAAFTLAACGGGSETSSPAPTVTETVSDYTTPEEEPAPDPVTVTETETETEDIEDYFAEDEDDVYEDDVIDEDIAAAALEYTWDDMTSSEQDDVCASWTLMRKEALDTFMEASDGLADRKQVGDFFDGKCEDY